MTKLKDIVKNVSKKQWAIVLVIVIAVVGAFIYQTTKKVDISKDANVSFSGYDGSGTATFDSSTLYNKSITAYTDKAKLGEYWKQKFIDSSATTDSLAGATSSDQDKIAKVIRWSKGTNFTLSKYNDLSNGDKVTLSVTSSEKDSPVKTVKKTFTVHGLKKVKEVSTNSVSKNLKFKFYGFNNHGTAAISSSKYTDTNVTFKIKNNGSLKNGDKISVNIPKELLNTTEGVRYTGDKTITVTVSGLRDVSAISNADAVQKVTDSLINDQYKSDDFSSYTNTFLNMYAFSRSTLPSNNYYSGGYDTDDSEGSNTVYLNDDSTSRADDNSIYIVALYKIVDNNSDSDDNTQYAEVTVKNLKYTDGKVNIDGISTDEDANTNTVGNSLETEQHNLMAKGLKIR